MKRLKSPTIALVVCVVLCVGCHPDNPFLYTKSEVSSHCEFDISKSDYKIDTLNSGKLVLTQSGYKVVDGNDNNVIGNDTCYLKMRAYFFWERDVK